jgi:site-specific DNA-methyltransferase (adenine-specific)
LVYAALPLGEGIIADPFMGSGSTVAAAEAMALHCIGVECHAEYFEAGADVIPRLATLGVALPTPAVHSAPPLWE